MLRQLAEIEIIELNRRMLWLSSLLMDLVMVSNAEVLAALISMFSKVVRLRFLVVLVAMSYVLGGVTDYGRVAVHVSVSVDSRDQRLVQHHQRPSSTQRRQQSSR
ncbi:hypothetical protein PF010_g14526 [Phytophthora fragariae]|uniref:Uncharacterized protein n=1 Tax=Phytophthora fragariae TaxID=53985 RepID=A0A6A3RPH3_9STRA|nr:hypothetical protein PF003_g26197 [Phytophthora fragariae]KAE8933247.1 hypothetical protein PF009_g16742 [Phytophthora fragariae]KAE9001278.1 hypothetical protein PF011_g13813 [Phytophthora fragariae]KAE9099949.1 hypothetical protein PF007_g15697 [Phytophthora fragariae]KAE9101200.1 hypothetical protein PF010_g14526 [Phytophthora fragariae]